MNFPSALIEEAVNQLSRFPGVGKKSALRMVLHILKQEPQEIIKLAQAIEQVRTLIKYCKRCHNVSDGEFCNICQSHKRNSELVYDCLNFFIQYFSSSHKKTSWQICCHFLR